MDNEDEQNDLDLDNEDGLEDSEESADEGAPSTETPDSTESESKRVSDLMAMFNKEQAKTRRLEKQLAERQTAKPKNAKAESDEFLSFAREQTRNTLFASDPRLAASGYEASDIAGDSPAEMRENLTKLTKVLDSVETKIRTEVLREYGFDPNVAGSAGASTKLPDFGGMSDEDFRAFIDKRSASY